jgi:hypothetical protein
MIRKQAPFLAIGLFSLSSLAACGGTMSEMPSDESSTLIAYARPATDLSEARPAPAKLVLYVEPIPAETLRDPQQLASTRQWMVRQIVVQCRKFPEDRYQRLVRPQLARQLVAAGLAPQDARYVLRDVDYSRRFR